jgi:hypothetical protein
LKWFKSQKGLSAVELIVGASVLITVFSLAFRNLVQLKSGLKSVNSSGPHMYFESFAVSRLKLYFAKLMQWTTHVRPPTVAESADFYCNDAAYFAYSPVRAVQTPAGNATIANATLGLDLRLALSTFSIADLAQGSTNLIDAAANMTNSNRPWGAMIPFHTVDEWRRAHSFSVDWCSFAPPRGPGMSANGSIGPEMCDQFARCTQEAGRQRLERQIGDFSGATANISGLTNAAMCFVFRGNLFSRANFNNAAADTPAGLGVIDNPTAIGLAVARVRFVNSTTNSEINCETAATEMNRSLKVTLTLYTALNAHVQDVKKLQVHKSIRELTSEKLGVAIPNCLAPGRKSNQQFNCIADPTWNYECAQDQSVSCQF